MKTSKLMLLSGLLSVILLATVVHVEAAALDRIKNIKDNQVTKVEKRIENKCERITARIDEKVAKYDTDHNARVDRYNKVKSAVQARVTKAETNGKDVTKLKEDLTILDTMIQKLSTDHAAYIEKLKLTKNYACGNSEGQFMQALRDAHTAQKQVWQDAKDLLQFVQRTLKADLKALG